MFGRFHDRAASGRRVLDLFGVAGQTSLVPLGLPTQPLELAARPADDIEIDPLQGRTQLRLVEVAVVVDPAANAWVVHLGQLLQGFVAAMMSVSEHSSELLGCPISRSLTTSCVGLELRPLSSAGITRLLRYYGPLRHPSAPGLSLTGVRLIIPDHAVGLPVLRALSLCTCCRQYPGAAAGCNPRSSTRPYQPSPVRRPGRPAHRPFRDPMTCCG